jgi:hypothetical protein
VQQVRKGAKDLPVSLVQPDPLGLRVQQDLLVRSDLRAPPASREPQAQLGHRDRKDLQELLGSQVRLGHKVHREVLV